MNLGPIWLLTIWIAAAGPWLCGYGLCGLAAAADSDVAQTSCCQAEDDSAATDACCGSEQICGCRCATNESEGPAGGCRRCCCCVAALPFTPLAPEISSHRHLTKLLRSPALAGLHSAEFSAFLPRAACAEFERDASHLQIRICVWLN